MLYCLPLLLIIVASEESAADTGQRYVPLTDQLHAFGSRLAVLVAFGGNYSFSHFESNLRQFAVALNCPNRHQLITIYFGELSMRIDCDYRQNLIDCISGDRILGNRTNAMQAFESSSFSDVVDNIIQSNERDILTTFTSILYALANEFIYNDYSNGVIIPETFMFAKKMIFLTNFVSKYISHPDNTDYYTLADIDRFLVMDADTFVYANALYQHEIVQTVWTAKIVYNRYGIDRQLSKSILPREQYCIMLDNGVPFHISSNTPSPRARTKLTILVYVDTASISRNRLTVVTNFLRRLVHRFASNVCSVGLDTGPDIVIDYLRFVYAAKSGDGPTTHTINNAPWLGRRSLAAYEYVLVDDQLNSLLAAAVADNGRSTTNASVGDAHDLQCDDYLYTDFYGHFAIDQYYLGGSHGGYFRHILLTNIVFDCFATQEFFIHESSVQLSLRDIIAKFNETVSFDYVYFNGDELRKTVAADELYQSLSAVFPASNASHNHLLHVNSIDDLMNQFDDSVAFCAERLQSRSLAATRPCHKAIINISTYNMLQFVIVGTIIAVTILITIAIAHFSYRQYRRIAVRNEFLRQLEINDRHQFDFIQTLWEVAHSSVEIDYAAPPIGKGSQSIVYSGKLNQKSPIQSIFNMENFAHFENCAIAVKTVRSTVVDNDAFFKQTLNEIRICSKIGYHENICTMLGYVSSDQLTCLLLELAQTDLLSALKSAEISESTDFVSNRNLTEIAMQIADGMLFIAGKKLIHRDLAARNVLLTLENRAMITDFGLCVEWNNDTDEYVPELSCPLPIRWLSIESISENRFSEKSDIWSYGILLHELYSFGHEPYESIASPKQIKSFLMSGQRMTRPTIAPENMFDLMMQCWQDKAHDRPRFEHVKNFLSEIESNQLDE